MRLARAQLDGVIVVAEVVEDGLSVLGEGGQDLLLQVAADPSCATDDRTVVPLDHAVLLAPVERPPSIRDFYVFEDHMRRHRASVGQEPDPSWYEEPCFYFTNPSAIVGPNETVRPPRGTEALDYEVEVAAVIGQEASNIDPSDPRALDCIAGFMILNDWSARDIQEREMRQNLGPRKSKDFAISLGPWLVTRDELPFLDAGRPRARMQAFVNGERWSDGELSDIYFPWSRLLAHASENTRLVPGDILGSGTCSSGCILELRMTPGTETRRWLREHDSVELRVEGLGCLSNTVDQFDEG
jgi:2-keto-4-pentenoate hydratase/2-oxohepta-3-ene-1,7-dioic acid hydratase in catechol pathway